MTADRRHLTASASALARSIRDGEAASVDVVAAHIAHVRRVNPTLNAVVADRFDAAMDEARRADEVAGAARAAGTTDALPPLHGVPCTIKECFAFEGMPQTAGLVARVGHVSREDATGVSRLRAAGAIPLGVTNLSELCMWLESSNRVYGRTHNPYDLRRIVGGSSGGEGAIVASGASPFGLGSDVAGSIRLPAFFNGVFGHKPTGGLVPGSGQYPNAGGEALRYLTTGPIARRAEDLFPLLQILAGPDGIDSGCYELELRDPAKVDLARVRVLDVATNEVHGVERALRDAQRRACVALAERGAVVTPTRFRSLRRSFDIWSAMLGTHNPTSFAAMLTPGGRFRFWPELARWLARRSPHTLPALVLAGTEKFTELWPSRTRRMIALGDALREELTEALSDDGVMLFPTFGRVAPRHGWPLLGRFRWVYTAIINVLGLPSTQVPLGLDARGLPLGLQVVGGPGQDHLTIAVALALEEALGGWQMPPPPPALIAPATANRYRLGTAPSPRE